LPRHPAGSVQMPPQQTATDPFDRHPDGQRSTVANPVEIRRTGAANTAPPFSLAAYLQDPDFQEIHTALVFEGLTLLAQPEANHRALGAMRIGAAGPNARTAMPVLRKLIKVEPDKTVRLRIAEAMLKAQPGDLDAANCLAGLLADRADWQVRQTAACALSAAAGGHNPVAVVRLTEALDDGNPRVRTMAALSLAHFGAEATDSLGRLETAAASDVPRVKAAANVALASIRRESNARPQNPAPPLALDNLSQRPVKTEPGFAQLDDQPGPLKPAPADVKLLDVPSDGAGEPASHTAGPNSEKPVAAGANSVVRPLRLEPSQHHHVPGKPSQPPLPARPVMQLDSSSDHGDGKVSPNQ
jgi:HEAT repeat protein